MQAKSPSRNSIQIQGIVICIYTILGLCLEMYMKQALMNLDKVRKCKLQAKPMKWQKKVSL